MLSSEFLSPMQLAKPKSAHSMQAGQGNTGDGQDGRVGSKGYLSGWWGLGGSSESMLQNESKGETRWGPLWVWAVGRS